MQSNQPWSLVRLHTETKTFDQFASCKRFQVKSWCNVESVFQAGKEYQMFLFVEDRRIVQRANQVEVGEVSLICYILLAQPPAELRAAGKGDF